jgi:DNA-binding transcriptional ArsR family regulator
MPHRALTLKELAELLGALAHPHRTRIIIELREGELDVNSIQAMLGISHSGVSQNLSVLRAHHIVKERRDGRHVYYSLTRPALADWLIQGLDFLEAEYAHSDEVREALQAARGEWKHPA